MLLGSEVIVMSVDDALLLVRAFLKPSTYDNFKKLQRLDVFDVLNALRDAVRRYDYGEEND